MTKELIVGTIELELTQLSISDDSNVDQNLIASWVGTHLNELVAAEVNSLTKAGKSIPAIYIKVADAKLMVTEDVSTFEADEDRMYVELDDDILDVNDDRGIVLIETEDGDEVKKTSVANFIKLKKLQFAKPTIENPLCYRRGQKIYFIGFTPTDIPFELVNVYYLPKQDILNAANSYELLASDSIISSVIDLCIERGKQALLGTQIDQTNDGVSPQSPVYHRQIASPNDQPQQ
jgi:hypothetical protein